MHKLILVGQAKCICEGQIGVYAQRELKVNWLASMRARELEGDAEYRVLGAWCVRCGLVYRPGLILVRSDFVEASSSGADA